MKDDSSSENTLSDAAEEGCTTKTLWTAADKHGKADPFCFHHWRISTPGSMSDGNYPLSSSSVVFKNGNDFSVSVTAAFGEYHWFSVVKSTSQIWMLKMHLDWSWSVF